MQEKKSKTKEGLKTEENKLHQTLFGKKSKNNISENGITKMPNVIDQNSVQTNLSQSHSMELPTSLKTIQMASSAQTTLLDESNNYLISQMRDINKPMICDGEIVRKPSWEVMDQSIKIAKELRESIKVKAAMFKVMSEIMKDHKQ